MDVPDHIVTLLRSYANNGDQIRSSRHAACIAYRGNILDFGWNKYKTHPMMYRFSRNTNKVCLHAEIDAIIKVINNHGTKILRKCDLYVIRVNKRGEIASSKPCPVCTNAMNTFGLKGYWT